MQLGAVTFVLAEAIFREFLAKVPHNPIARDLRDNACGRDAQAQAIAVDDCGLWQWERENWQPIDENVFGLGRERCNRRPHGLMCRAQNIDSINLQRINDANRPDNHCVADEVVINLLAQIRRELFGIVEFPPPEFFRKDYGCCYDRPGEGAAPGLVDAGDAGDAEGAKVLLITKTAAHWENLINPRLRELTI